MAAVLVSCLLLCGCVAVADVAERCTWFELGEGCGDGGGFVGKADGRLEDGRL